MDDAEDVESGVVHMNGSILVFPYGCFLWKVDKPSDVTVESLVPPLLLHRPTLEYMFIGSDVKIAPSQMLDIQRALEKHTNAVVEQMSVANAMGTFNILNAEDRQVAVALLLTSDE